MSHQRKRELYKLCSDKIKRQFIRKDLKKLLDYRTTDNDRVLITEFESLGCQHRKDAVITAQVFFELCEVKKYWNIEYKIHNSTKKLYLIAKQDRTATPAVFIPLETSINLDFAQLQEYAKFATDSDQRVFLVFVNADSTCVYYQITNGLSLPVEVTVKHLQQNRTEQLDAEIKRNAELIKQAAMCGTPITLPKKETTEKHQ